ncbi:MAG: hypothetical protein JHC33_05335 [Ignisphaera sp.]|nr:hypothetical protein [Ignisphaera sp.]
MKHTKIKVMTTTESEWATAVNHARRLGAVSSDGQYSFHQNKPSMIIDNNYIKYSSPTARSSGEQPLKISLEEFLNLRSLRQAGQDFDVVSCMAATALAVMDTAPCLSMDVASVVVLEQNAIIFRTQGLSWLEDRGVDVTMVGDKAYTLDISTNTAEELTPATIVDKATAAILENDMSDVYAMFATQFKLISEINYTKAVAAL